MVNCSYCKAEIKRLVFCSPSHKVMYHRTGEIQKEKIKIGEAFEKEEKAKIETLARDPKFDLCSKHGGMKLSCGCK